MQPDSEDIETTPITKRPNRLANWWRKFSFKWLLFRFAVYGMILFAVVFGAGILAIKVFVHADDVQTFIKEQVEAQTGGKFEIGSTTFDVLSGIQLKDVVFYPPKRGDTRGFQDGGEIDPVPLANFDALDVRYSIPRVLAGRLHINALQLVNPQFHLKSVDDVFNFESIIAYRAIKFPVDIAKEEEPVDSSDGLSIPFNPTLVFIPFDIMAQNVGIQNLKLDMIVEEKGRIAQVFVTNGLSVDVGLHWQGRTSVASLAVMSSFENPFEVDIRDALRDDKGELTGDLVQTLFIQTALNLRVELQDLERIHLDYGMRAMRLATPVAGFEDVGVYTKVRLALQKSLKGIDIKQLDLDIADTLSLNLVGAIAGIDEKFSVIDIKLLQNTEVDLANAAKLAVPFVPGLQGEGVISLKELRIEGELDTAKIMDAVDPAPLPFVSGTLWFEEVAAQYPGLGISMQPIAGSVSLATGPAIIGKGSQIDLSVDLALPELLMARETAVGPIELGIRNMNTKVTSRFLWPAMIAPILKVNIEAEHVTAKGKNIADVDVPLYVDIDGDGRQDLERMALSANIELTDLAEISASADCQNRCQRFRLGTTTRLESLANILAIATPLAGMFGFADLMPTSLDGGLDMQFGARGRMPDPLTTPPEQLVKEADVRFNAQLGITKLNTDIPIKKVKLRNFDNRILVSGDLAQQKVEVSQTFGSLGLDLGEAGATNPLLVERFSLDLNVINDVDGPVELAAIMRQLTTRITTKIFVGSIAMKSVLPRSVSDLQVDSRLKQVALQSFDLSSLRIRSPDFGSDINLSADTRIGADFLPTRVKAKVVAALDHSGDEKLPAGIKTNGKARFELQIESQDMKFAAIDGEADFQDFNVLIPGGKPGDPDLLKVEGIRGQVPLKQNVYIEDLLLIKEPAATSSVTEVKQATSEAETPEAPNSTMAFLARVEGDTAAKGEKDLSQAFETYYAKTEDKLLKNTNVMALVDYASIRPFYPEKRPLAIEKLEVANLELSQMEFDIELRQNWFALNQFMINFLGGKLQGDFQLAFEPDFRLPPLEILKSLRVSLHMTRLDTRQLIASFPNLKGKTSSWNVFSNPYIDGTIHFKFDPKTNDMSGGMEITSIGKEQLKMMLYYVDPYEQNPTISEIRSALTWGEVQHVSIPIKNGEIGMDVGVVVLKTPIPTPKLTRFPVSQLIDNFIKQTKTEAEGTTIDDEGEIEKA